MEGVQRDRAYSNNLYHKTRLESLDKVERMKNSTHDRGDQKQKFKSQI